MSGAGGNRRGQENRLSRWSRLKRKRAIGESVNKPDENDGRSTDSVANPRGAAAPRIEPDGTGQMQMVNGKPYMPPLAGPETDEDSHELPIIGASRVDGDIVEADVVVDDDPELTPEEAEAIKDLPNIEDLNGDSDFTAFLDKKVPEFIRRKALRKLWLSDPAFSFLDGMNEYDEDYSMVAELVAGASDYRPGEGGYSWRDKPAEPEDEDTNPDDLEESSSFVTKKDANVGDSADEGSETNESDDEIAGAAGEETHDMSIIEKSRLVQSRGGSSVRAPEYTANPYYQSPSVRDPIPAEIASVELIKSDKDEDDDLGDAEDEF